MFVGESFRTIDEKGRLVLPPPFRRILEESERHSVVIAPHEDKCLMLLRPQDFEQMAAKKKSEIVTPADRNNFRYFMAKARQLDIDKAGRVVIGEEFRRFAAIELGRDVAINGMLDYAEIWDIERYRQKEAKADATFVIEDEEDATA